MDDQHARCPGARRGFELGTDASGDDQPPAFESQIATGFEIGIIGKDNGDLAAHVDTAIGIMALADDTIAGKDQRQVGDRGDTGIAQRQCHVLAGLQSMGLAAKSERQSCAGLPVEPDERHGLLPTALRATGLQAGGRHGLLQECDRPGLAHLPRAASGKGVGRQDFDIGLDARRRNRRRRSGGEEEGDGRQGDCRQGKDTHFAISGAFVALGKIALSPGRHLA